MVAKKKNLLTYIAISLIVLALLYLVTITLSPSRRYKPNPYEFQVNLPAATDSSQLNYVETRQIAIHAVHLTALAIDPRNILYVAADSSLLILSSEGHLKARIAVGQTIRCLAAPDGKKLYVGFENHISVYDYAGRKKQDWSIIDEKSILTSLAVSEKHLFVADAGRRLVWVYDLQGRILRSIGKQDSLLNVPGFEIPSPYFDLLLDREDQLWVVNPGRHTIEQYTDTGKMRAFWGEAAMTVQGFCGCCNPTHIAMLSDGSFVTSEKGLARVKVYSAAGNLTAVVANTEQFDEDVAGLDLAIDHENNIYILDPSKKCVRVFTVKSL